MFKSTSWNKYGWRCILGVGYNSCAIHSGNASIKSANKILKNYSKFFEYEIFQRLKLLQESPNHKIPVFLRVPVFLFVSTCTPEVLIRDVTDLWEGLILNVLDGQSSEAWKPSKALNLENLKSKLYSFLAFFLSKLLLCNPVIPSY